MGIVLKETLESIIMNEIGKDRFEINADCCACGTAVTVYVDRTSGGGFGLVGGMSYESDSGGLIVKCPDCNRSQNKLACGQWRFKFRHKAPM